jgi:hypothetical protein
MRSGRRKPMADVVIMAYSLARPVEQRQALEQLIRFSRMTAAEL